MTKPDQQTCSGTVSELYFASQHGFGGPVAPVDSDSACWEETDQSLELSDSADGSCTED